MLEDIWWKIFIFQAREENSRKNETTDHKVEQKKASQKPLALYN